MSTYIPKQAKHPKERIEAKLEVELIATLGRYCEYLESDRDYVIAQALEIAFRKDKGFSEWLSGEEALVGSVAGDSAPASTEIVETPVRKTRRAKSSEFSPDTTGQTEP